MCLLPALEFRVIAPAHLSYRDEKEHQSDSFYMFRILNIFISRYAFSFMTKDGHLLVCLFLKLFPIWNCYIQEASTKIKSLEPTYHGL